MMVPLVILYEFSILLSVMIYRRRKAKEIGGDPPEGTVKSQ
jgi:Sec-independent protein secretion pathway component TatC